MHSTPTSVSETKTSHAYVVAHRLEDQQSAEALTAVITDLWDRLPIYDLMKEMPMVSGKSATDMEQAVQSIIESALFGGSGANPSNP